MSSLTCLLAFVSAITFCTSNDPIDPDYFYWRPYENGVIPGDAYVAGKRNGQDFYIGNGPVYPRGLMIGRITKGNPKMTVSTYATPDHRNTVYVISTFLKILCTSHPGQFEWIPSKKDEVFPNKSGECVLGGYEFSAKYENGYDLHVARTNLSDGPEIGKSAPNSKTFGFMYYVGKDGKEKKISDNYGTLFYNQ